MDAPWQLIKIDRQIVAITKVAGAHRIYTNDDRLGKFAAHAGIEVVPLEKMPLPPRDLQLSMDDFLTPRTPAVEENHLDDDAEIDIAEKLDSVEDKIEIDDSDTKSEPIAPIEAPGTPQVVPSSKAD